MSDDEAENRYTYPLGHENKVPFSPTVGACDNAIGAILQKRLEDACNQ